MFTESHQRNFSLESPSKLVFVNRAFFPFACVGFTLYFLPVFLFCFVSSASNLAVFFDARSVSSVKTSKGFRYISMLIGKERRKKKIEGNGSFDYYYLLLHNYVLAKRMAVFLGYFIRSRHHQTTKAISYRFTRKTLKHT